MANQSRTSLLSFNAGEWTPKLEGRVDLPKYKASCRTLENAFAEVYGIVTRRPGMRYVANAFYDGSGSTRFVEFVYSSAISYVLSFYKDNVGFFKDGAQITLSTSDVSGWLTATAYSKYNYVSQGGLVYRCLVAHTSGTFATDLANGKWVQDNVYYVETGYTDGQVAELSFQQINDVLEIAHSDTPVKVLSRLGDKSWTFASKTFTTPPLRDENLTTTTIAPSATTGSITLTASASLFNSGHVGSYWQIGYSRPSSYVEIALTGNGTSSTIEILGTWDFETHGTWQADVAVERSYDGSTWERVKVVSSRSPESNYISDGQQTTKQATYRLKVENWSSGSGRALLTRPDSYVYGLAQITGYTSPTVVNATVVEDFFSTSASVIWREGAWSAYRGYPSALCLYEGRMFYAGSGTQSLTVWGSSVDGFNDFEYGSNDSDAFSFTLASNRQNAIQWMVGHNKLCIGTSGDEWTVSGGQGEEAITATNVRAIKQTSFGSDKIQARVCGDVVLFVQRGGKRIREFLYSFEKDGYIANDATRFADHITGSYKFKQITFMQTPFPCMWAVTTDNRLVSMMYDRAEDVNSWSVHTTQTAVYSVAILPGVNGNDEVWVACDRNAAGLTIRTAERMIFDPIEAKEDMVFVDSAISKTGPATTFSGLTNLAGQSVDVLADGAPIGGLTVSALGVLTLPKAATKVKVGLSYTSVLMPQRIDVDGVLGPSQGMTRRIREIVVRFNESLGLTYGDGKEKDANGNIIWRDLPFRDRNDPMDESPALFTGDKRLLWPGEYEYEGDLILKQRQPLPWQIVALIVKYEVTGR